MGSNMANVSFRIDSDLKVKADKLFDELGMSMTTAFNIFLRQSVRQGCIPFAVTTKANPNVETIAALLEARELMANPTSKAYPVDEALRDLKK